MDVQNAISTGVKVRRPLTTKSIFRRVQKDVYFTIVLLYFFLFSCIIPHRESFFALDAFQRQLVVGSTVGAGAILAYALQKRTQVKSIPVGDGWWRAGEKQLSQDEKIYPFKVQTSDEEIKVFFKLIFKQWQSL